MRLKDIYAALISNNIVKGHTISDMDYDIKGITFNSKAVKSGYLFVCKGERFKVDYLKEASDRGAAVYVSEVEFCDEGVDLPSIIVTDIRHAMAIIALLFYDDPSSKMNVIGVTGTKGKTTTTHMMKSVLDKWHGHPISGLISTIEMFDGKERADSVNTTPEAMELQMWLSNMVDNQLENCCLEVSSQALRYERTYGIGFKIGVFLNIGRDHISPREHKDFDDYFSAKLMLLDQSEIGIINLDMDYADEVMDYANGQVERCITYSLENPTADFYASNITKCDKGLEFNVKSELFTEKKNDTFRIAMSGRFNVSNALAVIAATTTLGVPIDDIKSGLRDIEVEGRTEVFSSKDGKIIAVADYAHNKMSFESLIKAMEEEYPVHIKNLLLVFGSVGDKSHERREELGTIAGQKAKKSYITSDENESEPFDKIAEEIAGFVRAQGGEYTIIENRSRAVEKAFADAKGPTMIMACGYGRITVQRVNGSYVPMEGDAACIERCLAEYDKTH